MVTVIIDSDEITDQFAGMLNDIEEAGNFGYFVDRDIPGQFHFYNGATGASYVFTYQEIWEIWGELYG